MSATPGDDGTGNDPEPVQRITNAPESLAVEQGHRMRVYGLQMAIRIVCLFLAVLIPHPIRWVFVAGAVLIPYLAVLLANAGRDRVTTDVMLMERRQISSAPTDESAPHDMETPTTPSTPATPTTPETEQ